VVVVVVAVVAIARDTPDPLAAPPELDDPAVWAAPNRDLAATRAAQGSRIDSTTGT